MDKVVLVDQNDHELGTMEKIETHRKGLLHRAFSLFVFNSQNQLLIQKRAAHKYHSPGLWTNTCCSHPRKGETITDAARRRIFEEMGITTDSEFIYKFIYKADLEGEMIEHELDHVLVGYTDDTPNPNPEEVESYLYDSMENIQQKIKAAPEEYTYWFKIIMETLPSKLENLKK
ncbi:isopentenyl-diphosphate Delta-isomerase [Fulvivirga sediminis]|uniref:Isopentenyl-diphosphate delta-isomerase n=1 Tax=Fulvivirga sediminis TaxID=2803949 RepID=A0A937K1L4_9BACT|nr:isopentenyl-diphosphate Delta-isomerase [Fulvivirga sediminis]MBL3657460.1 isopentenyl-diphosphate Delta-isomerase [Fulvivirga sediminis]